MFIEIAGRGYCPGCACAHGVRVGVAGGPRTPNVARAPSCHYFPGGQIPAENWFPSPEGGGSLAGIVVIA